jgi:hypothetical protein
LGIFQIGTFANADTHTKSSFSCLVLKKTTPPPSPLLGILLLLLHREEKLRQIFMRHHQKEEDVIHKSTVPQGWNDTKLANVAKALEDKLYQASASDLECYCNIQTLDDRVRQELPSFIREQQELLFQTQQRPPCQNRPSRVGGPPQQNRSFKRSIFLGKHTKKQREQVLRDILRSPKFELTRKLVQEINLLRLRSVARPCSSTSYTEEASHDGENNVSARHSLPGPASELFFNTPLVAVFEKVPLDRLSQQNWNALLTQATYNYKAYKEYVKETRIETISAASCRK